MEQSKKLAKKEELSKKLFVLSIIISILLIVIGLFFLLISPFILYGVLYGLFGGWLTFFSILYLEKKGEKIGISLFSWLIFLIRIILFLIFFLIALLIINTNTGEFKGMLEPINIFAFFVAYLFFPISVFLLPIYDYINSKISRN